jgi:tRNA A58 N-methylase Trm61
VRSFSALDIPRIFNISESAHRIQHPITGEKLATLGAALRLERGTRVLDLGSGSAEMLCTWARDHGVIGVGIDMSQLFTEQAKLRAEELGVADREQMVCIAHPTWLAKSECRNPKSETSSKDRNSNAPNGCRPARLELRTLEHSCLFRVSIFGFRV